MLISFHDREKHKEMNNNGGRALIIRYVLSLMAIALMGTMSSLFGDRSIIY